jgi:outer membrane lipoprotein-sorting protein
MENVDGHPCYKIAGRIAIAYGSGNVAGAHKAVLWIDKGSFLIRKLFEDTPDEDSGSGFISTITTTFDPQANPKVDAARFNFKVPSN